MKQLSIFNKRGVCLAFTAFAFGIAGTAHAQGGTSGQGTTEGTSGSSSTYKKDPSKAGSGGDRNAGSRSGSDAGEDKSLGSSALGSANSKPKTGSDSSLGGSTDQGFTNTKGDQSKKGSRGDRN